MDDLVFAPALTQARLVRDRQVSSRDLVELYLDRIERLDPQVGSYATVLADEARALAGERDAALARGGDLPPLHGVPVSIKDLTLLEGTRTTFGTRAAGDFVAPLDGEVAARLKRAGMVPLGKTTVSELGALAHTAGGLLGTCRNPWDVTRNAAGSSSGAAAALAAGLCPASQGSDGGGSIRIPAAVTGVYGLAPARDRVSNGPLTGDVAFGLAVRGVLARTVADAGALLDAIAGYAAGDPGVAPPPRRPFAEEAGRDPGTMRVGVTCETISGDPPGPEVAAAIDDARALLDGLGHHTFACEVGVPADTGELFADVWAANVASQPFPVDSLQPATRWLVERGRAIGAPAYLQAQYQLQLLARAVVRRFAGMDALLAPAVTSPALPNDVYDGMEPQAVFDHQMRFAGLCSLANVAGLPACALPLYWDQPSGLPVGVQLIGQPWDEAGLLRLSAQLEQARPWAGRIPPLGAECRERGGVSPGAGSEDAEPGAS